MNGMGKQGWIRTPVSGIARKASFPALLALICAFSFMVHADFLPVSRMEARNLVAAREMLQDGHWLRPTMNGALRLAKPPLPTWLSAAMALAIDDPSNLTALRLPAAVSSLLMVLAAYGLGRHILESRAGPFWRQPSWPRAICSWPQAGKPHGMHTATASCSWPYGA